MFHFELAAQLPTHIVTAMHLPIRYCDRRNHFADSRTEPPFQKALTTTEPAVKAPSPHAAIKLIQHDTTIDVMMDGTLFTTYHFADDFVRPYVRPFFWPVRASDGTELTNDQAQTIPDHPHQRSIWIGHADVDGVNHWKITSKPIQAKQRHIDFKDVTASSFTEDLIWEDGDAQPLLNEVRRCSFINFPDHARGVDVSIQLSPINKDVTFGTKSDHGFFAIRMLPVIGDSAHFLNSNGLSDDAVGGQRADWCDEFGEIDGKTYGIAIFDAPDNFRHPPYWHAHSGDRLMADIFGPNKSDKGAALPDTGPITLAVGKTLALHYLAVIHFGAPASADLPRQIQSIRQWNQQCHQQWQLIKLFIKSFSFPY